MSEGVPEGWTKERLGNYVKLESGNAFQSWEFSDKGTAIVRISNIRNGKIDLSNAVYYKENNKLEKFLITNGDILLAMSGATTGKIGKYTYSSKSYLNQRVGRFKIIDKTNSENEYIYQLVRSREFAENTLIDAIGGAQPNISSSQVENVVYKFPPLPEQKKIASILTSVDEVIENTQKQIDKLQDLKKATMNELLTKGIGHTEFKDSELGRIPKSWEVVSFDEISKQKTLGTTERGGSGEMLPLVKMGNIQSGEVLLNSIEMVSQDKLIFQNFLLKGDFLFNTRNTPELVGKVGNYNFDMPAAYDNNLLKIDFCAKVSSVFMGMQLNDANCKKRLKAIVAGTTSVAAIYWNDLKRFKILKPMINEQIKITQIITSLDSNIRTKKQKLAQTQSLKKSLMQDLLTGKVRVQVN